MSSEAEIMRRRASEPSLARGQAQLEPSFARQLRRSSSAADVAQRAKSCNFVPSDSIDKVLAERCSLALDGSIRLPSHPLLKPLSVNQMPAREQLAAATDQGNSKRKWDGGEWETCECVFVFVSSSVRGDNVRNHIYIYPKIKIAHLNSFFSIFWNIFAKNSKTFLRKYNWILKFTKNIIKF